MKQNKIVEVHTCFNTGDIGFLLRTLNGYGIRYEIIKDIKQRLITYPYCVYDGKVVCVKVIISKFKDGEL